MRYLILMLFALLWTASGQVYAQSSPISDTLSVNSISARVQSNGAFFLGNPNGAFRVPATSGGSPEISLLKAAGLWLGGKDSGGNLKLSAQLYNENGKADFFPGVLLNDGIPYSDFNLIAGVTGAEVAAHIQSPNTPTPAVYGWPAKGNAYFTDYHGFDLPQSNYSYLAGFYDNYNNGVYQPSAGDYPVVSLRGCPNKYYVDEEMWFPFHDVGAHTQSGGQPLNMEVQTQFFGFDCQEGSPVDRVVYVIYKLINKNTVPLDSCYFGVFMDFEIGNGGDDFIGCDPLRRAVFGYNGDDVDEGGFETTPPVLAVDFLRVPLNELGEEVTSWHFVPVEETDLNSPVEYYNLLKGRHPDGTPYPNNGLMYTGNPLDPAAWSEKKDGNTPGDRKTLTSFGPFTLFPGAINEIVLGYAWVRKDPNGSLSDNLSILGATIEAIKLPFYNCFELFDGCPGSVSTTAPEKGLQVSVSPNPVSDWLQVTSDAEGISAVFLYDATGRLIWENTASETTSVTIQMGALQTGFYWLQVQTKEGRSDTFKLVRQ